MTERRRLVESVVERGRLESNSEAEGIIRAVTGALAPRVGPEAWEVIGGAVPADLHGQGSPSGGEAPSASDLFEDVGERLQLGTPTSATYVRAVLEVIGEVMPTSDRDRLGQILEDEFLALFEVDHRGELTEDDGATPGATIIDPSVEEGDDRRQ